VLRKARSDWNNEGGFGMNRKLRRLACVIGASILGTVFCAATAQAAPKIDRLHQAWRTAIARKALPAEGCFTASYPAVVWRQVPCRKAPNIPYVPRGAARAAAGGGLTVGNGNDYAAVSRKLISAATGSFPAVQNVVSETGAFGANDYTLQINSNFMPGSRACARAAVPSSCSAWQQFVYASGQNLAFMQYWLIGYDTTCPAGWNTFIVGTGNDCWKNGKSVFVGFGSPLPITELPNMSLEGSAQARGSDALTLVDGAQAWGTTGKDNVLFLSKGWKETEFNVIGDGNGTAANLNTGAILTVRIDLTTATTRKPLCKAGAGTTGETNNLTLGACTAAGGATPAIQFLESD
jgi:hypothetical protein